MQMAEFLRRAQRTPATCPENIKKQSGISCVGMFPITCVKFLVNSCACSPFTSQFFHIFITTHFQCLSALSHCRVGCLEASAKVSL